MTDTHESRRERHRGRITRDVQVTRDIEYGVGRVGTTTRPLLLDRYEPAGVPARDRPVLVLAFGGAFHRGSRQDDSVKGETASNTSIADYCRMFASHGYVACSIDYRLVQEDPVPGETPVVADPASIPRSRVDVVRGLLGLPPATPEMLWRGIEAASDDMATAVRFVRSQVGAWRIDPDRIAVGGFSAGARTALNAAFGEGIGVAAVVSLSGYMAKGDLERLAGPAPARSPHPAVLLLSGERDLDYVRAHQPILVDHFRKTGVTCVAGQVLGADHFYPADALARSSSGEADTVERMITAFLARHVPA